jgi:hypothetical protein
METPTNQTNTDDSENNSENNNETNSPDDLIMPVVRCDIFQQNETNENYIVISFRLGESPEVFKATTKKKLKRLLKKLYRITDQQYLFVIQGESMTLSKSSDGLTLRLSDRVIRVPLWGDDDTRVSIDDGWIGD